MLGLVICDTALPSLVISQVQKGQFLHLKILGVQMGPAGGTQVSGTYGIIKPKLML
jgi:hypothetical protein